MTDLVLKERIAEVMHDMSDADLVELHNTYCEIHRYYDDQIYYMSQLNELTYGMPATDVIDRFKEVNTDDNYYVEGIYGAESFDYYDDAPTTYFDEIVEYCADNEDDLGNSDIADCIEEWQEEQEAKKEKEEDDDYWSHGGEEDYMENHYLRHDE